MAAMQSLRSTPVQRGWLSQEEVDEGFGVVQLYPGAIMMDLAAFIGYRLRRIRGAMAKIGSVAFGNGTVILLVFQQDAVAHHWLTVSQFSVGVAFGQVTLGPILTTAAFVGFAAAGW